MNVIAWILQIILALLFLGAGGTKLTQSKDKLRPMMGWVDDYSDRGVKLIAGLEVLGAIGLILPHVLGIAEAVVPLAATGLALTMVGAIMTHIRLGEMDRLAVPIITLALTLFVAIERFSQLS